MTFASDDKHANQQRQNRAGLLALVTLVGTVFAIILCYFRGYYLGLPYPHNTFLFRPPVAFSDFLDILEPVRRGDPFSSPLSVYPPFAYLPLQLLSPLDAFSAYAVFAALFIAVTLCFVWRSLAFLDWYPRATTTWVLSVMSYPVLINLDRGNLEMMAWVFVCGFAVCFERKPRLAACFLACASAVKIYPILFTALFLARRQKREAALTWVLCGALSLVSAALYPGGVARSMEMMRSNFAGFVRNYAQGGDGLQFGSSLWGVLKLVIHGFGGVSPESLPRLYGIYTLVFGILGVALYIYVARSGRPLWHKVTLLCLALLLFPPVSSDYKLIHLFLPILLFLNAPTAPRANINWLQTLCFALILVPKPFPLRAFDVGVGVIINPLLMLALGALMQWEWTFIRAQNASAPSLANTSA